MFEKINQPKENIELHQANEREKKSKCKAQKVIGKVSQKNIV
jgi:hypothetical protein